MTGEKWNEIQVSAFALIGKTLVELLVTRKNEAAISLFAEYSAIKGEWEDEHNGKDLTGEVLNWKLGEHHDMPPEELVRRLLDGESFEELHN